MGLFWKSAAEAEAEKTEKSSKKAKCMEAKCIEENISNLGWHEINYGDELTNKTYLNLSSRWFKKENLFLNVSNNVIRIMDNTLSYDASFEFNLLRHDFTHLKRQIESCVCAIKKRQIELLIDDMFIKKLFEDDRFISAFYKKRGEINE